jgi:hypothetical protein
MTAATRHPVVTRAGMAPTLLAAVLLLGSAVLQQLAALERWVVAAPMRHGDSIQSHLFDYSFPADPWEDVGAAAVLFGCGYLLLALGVVAALGSGRRRDRIAAVVVASCFGYMGMHALLSGLLGAPTILQSALLAVAPGLLAPVGLVVLAVSTARRAPAMSAACVLLLGATAPGYVFATFTVAPLLVGYQSFDTTPWTESVVAAATGLAGVALLLAAALRTIPRTSARAG